MVTGYFEHHAVPWREDGHQVVADLPGGSTAEVDFDGAEPHHGHPHTHPPLSGGRPRLAGQSLRRSLYVL
ncbi:hypothetical protein GCM10020000_78530 [Streptomyces olivoverticillatus]